jgi:3-oxoacyl-[acyl-carrier protein] reductase
MDLGIAGKTAVVTASSKGLGRASAVALAAEGCNVAISARHEPALRDTEAAIRSLGVGVQATVADVTEPDAPARLISEAGERFGTVDILVANAGGPPPAAALDLSDDAIESAINANLLTSVRLAREAVPWMRRTGWGRIVLITSYTVMQPAPNLALSNTARTGLWAWAKTAASDLFGSGITLNAVCPGSHATDRMRQLGGGDLTGMGDPDDFGRIVAFLCSQYTGFLSGVPINVDGTAVKGLL